MTKETYIEMMKNLDIIEAALNNVAKKVGHVSIEVYKRTDEGLQNSKVAA